MANPPNSRNGNLLDADLSNDHGASDGESSYAESPADGYFTTRSHPRDMFVENSSATQDSKASEAAAGSATDQHSPLSTPAASLRTRSYSAESLPVMDAGPAPPDYAAATAHRSDTQSSPFQDNSQYSERPSMETRTSYGSMDESRAHSDATSHQQGQDWSTRHTNSPFGHGFPFGNNNSPFGPGFPFGNGNNPFGAGFPFNNHAATPASSSNHIPPDHEPQQMSDRVELPDNSHEETVLLRWNRPPQPKRTSWFSRSPCKLRTWIKIVAAIAIIVLIISVARSAKDPGEARNGSGDDNKRKGATPTAPGGSDGGEDSRRPPQATTTPAPTQKPSASCPLKYQMDTVGFGFQDPGSFFFTEDIERNATFQGSIQGDLRIRPAQDGQENDIVLYLAIGTTAPWQVSSLDYVQTRDGFFLKLPYLSETGEARSERPCMKVNAWIDVRKGVRLDELGLNTAHLNIIIEEGLSYYDPEEPDNSHLYVKNLANFGSVSGDISSVYWSSRDTVIRTVSGDITGDYDLRDSLEVHSTSGDVVINVKPREVDEENPKPADFSVKAVSGKVDVDFPTSDIPERLYQTRVETTSGDIIGSYMLGTLSTFHSVSGDLKLQLLPYYVANTESELQTSCFSSKTDVTILTPYRRAGTPWRQLHHSGSSTSGDFRIVYPSEWEGHVDVSTKSGSISVKGNVRKLSEDKLPWSHHWSGVKGSGGGNLGLQTLSGDIKIQVGH